MSEDILFDKSGIQASAIEKIRSIFSDFPEIKKAVLFGSRAMGNYKPHSDVDLAVYGTDINSTLLHKVEMRVDDLMLPFKCDLINFNQINNDDLTNHIERVGINFYSINNSDQEK